MGKVSETPTPTTCLKSMAAHLEFVRQYAPHLYRRTFLASKLRRKANPAIRLPFVLQYPSHLYGNTPPPICTAILLEKYWGLGSPERFSMQLVPMVIKEIEKKKEERKHKGIYLSAPFLTLGGRQTCNN